MARRAAVLVALAAAPSASLVAPVAPLSTSQRQRTVVQESFGFDFAEDQAENTDLTILGERRLKEEFIRSYKPTATVLEGKPYPVFQEVQEKKLLSGTVNSGLLRALDDLGLGLGDVEKLLPVIDKAGVLGLVRKNLPLAIIATGYILIEPAPFLLPVLGALLGRARRGIWTAVAAVTTAAEIYLTAFASFDDSGVVALLLAPLLLIAGALSLVPAAIGAVKALAAGVDWCGAVYVAAWSVVSRARRRRRSRARHDAPVRVDGVRLAPALEARAADGRVDGVRGFLLVVEVADRARLAVRVPVARRPPPLALVPGHAPGRRTAGAPQLGADGKRMGRQRARSSSAQR